MTARHQRTAQPDDAGVTIVEVIIYGVFSAVVAALVASMFISTVIGQSHVTTTTEATTRGQAVAQGIERALRNGRDVTVVTDASGHRVLSVLTTLDEPCQAWRVSPVGELDVAVGAGLASWGTLVEHVEAIEGTPFFSEPFRAGSDLRVRYSFAVTTDGEPVNFSGTITLRAGNDNKRVGEPNTVEAACS